MRKTQGVYDLVKEVLGTMSQPYGEDIIEDVFLAIESHPSYSRRYQELSADLVAWVVNNWIGRYVRQITGMRAIRKVQAKRSKFITAYTKLSY